MAHDRIVTCLFSTENPPQQLNNLLLLLVRPCRRFLFQVYSTKNPNIISAGAVLCIAVTAIMFFVFDCLVRKEFQAKKDLLQARRQFMRFVCHEGESANHA